MTEFSNCLRLQWGRAFVGAEISPYRGHPPPASPGFNGAAPLWARRYLSVLTALFERERLQWGRAFVGAEIGKTNRRLHSGVGSFNGAAPLWARR